MHPEYKSFLETYKQVVRLGTDMALSDTAVDTLQKNVPITKEEFLSSLYEPRAVESYLKRLLHTSLDLICFVGPQGAGKTTIATKVIWDLSSSKRRITLPIYIDLRSELSQKAFEVDTTAALTDSIRRTLIDHYMDRLFPLQEQEPKARLELWAFLLQEPDDLERPFQIFHSLRDIRESAVRQVTKYRLGHEERRNATLLEWLQATYLKEPEVETLTKELDKRVDVAHLAYAARFLGGYDRQVLWLDNLDALPEGLQPEIVHILRRLHLLAASYLSTVVAVREENVFRFSDPEANAPPHQTRVLLEIPRDENNRPFYPALDVPVINFQTLKKLIYKRLVFARNLQLKLHREACSKIPQAKTVKQELERTEDPAKKSIWRDWLEEIDEEVELWQPISDARFNYLKAVSDALLKTLQRENAVFLANNSLRDILYIHRDCLGFFLQEPQKDKEYEPRALKYPRWYLSTLFLCWIRNTMRTYQIRVYDVIDEVSGWLRNRDGMLGCFFPHLMITCVWNLTLEKLDHSSGLYSTPRVEEVVTRLMAIGFERDQLLEEMYNLCGGKTGLLGIRSKTRLSSPSQILDNHFIYATYRGKCLVAHTSCSFGYLAECVREYEMEVTESADGKPGEIPHPNIRSTEAWTEALLPHLCSLAEMHITGLRAIKARETLGGAWLQTYLKWFGVPQQKPYRRSVPVGRRLTVGRRALQLECILSSLEAYVRGKNIHRNVQLLHREFIRSVDLLEKSDLSWVPGNFHVKLGLGRPEWAKEERQKNGRRE